MSDIDLTIHEPDSLNSTTGAYGAELAWSEEVTNSKGRMVIRSHSLRLTAEMIPMLTAAIDSLTKISR